MDKGTLSLKEQRFVAEFLKDQKGGPAAVRAGYAKRSSDQMASRMLRRDKVRKAVDAALARINERASITKERVLQSLLNIAEFDPRRLFNSDGTIKPMSALPNDVALAIASVESDDSDGDVKKVKLWDKVKALELLGRHLKLFDDPSPLAGVPMVINIVPAHNPQAGNPGH